MRIFLTCLLAASLFAPGPASAESLQDRVVGELQAQGFDVVEGRSTLLGRYRIVAEAPGLRREIVLNLRTGEVLRDLVQHVSKGDDPARPDVSGTQGADGKADGTADDSPADRGATEDSGQGRDGAGKEDGNGQEKTNGR